MLTTSASRAGRRGIVLVLVLAMLGLLALIGITFATYAGQSRINNRNFMLSLFQPQADELIDFGMSQLITDTNDIRSVIRGHSLARDMFGNDATGNALLSFSPASGLAFSITGAAVGPNVNQYISTTNIASNDHSFFGYTFTRWIMRVKYLGPLNLNTGGGGAINQSFEVLIDSGYNQNSSNPRTFLVYINPIDAGGSIVAGTTADPYLPAGMGTALYNPTIGTGLVTQLPGLYIQTAAANNSTLGPNTFTLDGRWLHAFNGPGVGGVIASTGVPASYYGNYRYTSGPNVNQPSLGVPPLTGSQSIGLDEDYDACDLENWFLAVQSADGQVIIPSFHRPAIIRNDPNNGVNDWLRQNVSNNGSQLWADSAARILRPCQADGHDASTFPDLYPDATTGQIPYDVDNDGDGKPDSVWLDLGYPARRDASGRLYKPLYAFMVIGLNGRIPLNTAGNLADLTEAAGIYVPATANSGTPPPSPAPPQYYAGPTHASHLGNSISEVDPLYALQNAFDSNTGSGDPLAAFAPPEFGYVYPVGTGTMSAANNTQVDNAGIDVRLTQLRNLLAGTRPPAGTDNNASGAVNGDNNYVFYTTGPGIGGQQFFMPNGIAEPTFIPGVPGLLDNTIVDANGFPYLVRSTTPIPGRWGEAQSIPGTPFPNPAPGASSTPATAPQFVNVVGDGDTLQQQGRYNNPVRAGYSVNIRDIINGLAPDAGDDNFNTYDPFPSRSVSETIAGTTYTFLGGEYGDRDYYDAAGGMLFPVERMRRWLTPADINGTGAVTTWNQGRRAANHGSDALGRVEFSSYFRPPGSPGVITTNYTVDTTTGIVTPPVTAVVGTVPVMGGIVFPDNPGFYTYGHNPAGIVLGEDTNQYPYLPDLNSNPTHGLESSRFPNQSYTGFSPQVSGGSPAGVTNTAVGGPYLNVTTSPAPADIPIAFPTYDYYINANFKSDGLNDADEMNLYSPNPLLDSPFGPTDLEWLYRQQDVDGASMTSRLLQLAPISFTNGLDGARRRRLFSLDFWDLNTFSWTNDNPSGAFPTNSRFAVGANAGFSTLNYPASTNLSLISTLVNPTITVLPSPTMALAHRDKKINLNYPLPVSNDPNEPVRQKWINDTYLLLKSILPPKAVDTPEELAQLSQYVINIVDFRDTDGTMTHWINPDVGLAGVLPITTAGTPPAVSTVPTTAMTLVLSNATLPTTVPATNTIPLPLNQYGMEYNPVALNEVLAFSYVYASGGAGAGTRANRFFVELVNTQTSPELSTSVFNAPAAATPGTGFTPVLDLGGFVYTAPAAAGGPSDAYSGGSWDIVFTADDPYSRPDPYTGQLVPYGNTYAATPLSQYTFNPPAVPSMTYPNQPTNPPEGDPAGTTTDGYNVMLTPLDQQGQIPWPIPASSPQTSVSNALLSGITSPLATDYFYVFGNLAPGASVTTGVSPNEVGTPAPGVLQNADPPPTQTGPPPTTTTPGTVYYNQIANRTTTPPTLSPLPASMIQSMKTAMDPVNGAPSSTTSPIPLYPGVLPYLTVTTASTTSPNPSTLTNLPTNYSTKLPVASLAATIPASPAYYWVCLRRPANLFAPVSVNNPMVVVDATRFPYIDGTGPLTTTGPIGGPPKVPTVTATTGNYIPYSVQRYQPFRGGHAVPVPAPTGSTPYTGLATTTIPVDPRYGYSEQIVVPSAQSQLMKTQGIYYYVNTTVTNPGGGTTTTTTNYPATPYIYHTLGWANELEQGSGASGATAGSNGVIEPWDYFPFNDRDFTSVAELMLVPGCSPGLFTKQFVEFAPSAGNVLNIFNAVIPNAVPPTGGPNGTIQGVVATTGTTGGTGGGTAGGGGGGGGPTGSTASYNFVQPYNTGSTPFAYTDSSTTSPVPHSFPYLNDEFFYTGFGGLTTIDTGGLVGGYAADGWFKMFEFFEVPSQANGAIGPVAQGSNFDWLRQDLKPGQLNLNLIMDEEVFFSLTGDQSISQSNGQNLNAAGTSVNPSDQFSQNLLNFNQIPGLPNGNYTLAASSPASPAFMLLAPTVGATAPGGTAGYSPVPLVVTSTLANGTPATAHPISSQGMAAMDPVSNYFFGLNNTGTGPLVGPPWIYGNGLKTAWVQFLNLRHGGSGYIFGFGTGAVGQNSAVGIVSSTGGMTTVTPPQSLPLNNSLFATGIPADRPFHSLSYPDIDYTVMRPAALPPSPYTNPVANSAATTIDTTTTPPTTIYYAGDPGVRNPTMFVGYPTANYPGTLAAGTAIGTTGTLTTPWGAAYEPVYPPPIPTRRLFQLPDGYRGGSATLSTLAAGQGATGATFTLVEGASNASSAGDPFLNNLSPVVPTGVTVTTNLPYTAPGAVAPMAYFNAGAYVAIANLSGSGVNLYWPGTSAARLHDGVVGDAATTVALPSGVSNPNLGSGGGNNDNRQHPYWRSEQLQRIMNLTTPRTHQFAVWVTVGFFEVKRQGDQGMFVYDPTLAFDILGPEVGATNGKNVRFRAFYLVDRLQLTGFNPSSPTGFRQAIAYRQRIQ